MRSEACCRMLEAALNPFGVWWGELFQDDVVMGWSLQCWCSLEAQVTAFLGHCSLCWGLDQTAWLGETLPARGDAEQWPRCLVVCT